MKSVFLSKFKSLFLFLSAFVPMHFLILVKLLVDILNHNKTFNVLNIINILTLSMFIFLGFFGVYFNIFHNNHSNDIITIKYFKNLTDQHFLGYFSLFVLFALQLDLTYVSGYCTYVLIFIFIGIVYIKNSLFYINPLLNIMGFSFYDIIFISKGEKQNLRAFSKHSLEINKKYKVKFKSKNFAFIIDKIN